MSRRARTAAFLALPLLLTACAEEVGPATSAPAVTFVTGDGITLRGHLFGSGQRWVILSHMFPTDQTGWFPFAGELALRGYHVLTYDFRGYGESDGQKQIDRIDRDLTAALEFVRGQKPLRVVLIGASMGGTAAVIVASRQPVDGVITLSAPLAFRGLDAARLDQRLKVPSLFISAELDGDNQVSARRLYEAAQGERSLDIVPGSSHGIRLVDPSRGSAVRADIITFLERYAASS